MTLVGAAAFGLLAAAPAEARNAPCSGSKGGVKACQGEKFLCNDGWVDQRLEAVVFGLWRFRGQFFPRGLF